AKDNFLRF
uniref:FMRFamide-related protein 1 n=1 Tax=Rhodnius prolixus TaxID=13249 RepID=FAR1_RHOPR|nr:RecName: Full=FMRFamide-related protein 1; Short=Rhopr-FLRFamide-1 [Rhodnius prolixus]